MIKKLLLLFFSVFILIGLGLLVLINVINPNDFKPLIAQEVKKVTGRDLVIAGDIRWQLWPNLGLSVEQVALKNPEGFAEADLIKFDKADMSLAIMPLMSKQLNVGMVQLQGARIFVQTLASGQTNLDGLMASDATPAKTRAASDPSTDVAPTTDNAADAAPTSANSAANSAWTFHVNGVEILNASATYRDDKEKMLSEINALNLSLGQLAFGQWMPLTLDFSGRQNELTFTAKAKLDALLVMPIEQAKLRNLSLELSAQDKALQLTKGQISLDNFAFNQLGQLSAKLVGKSGELAWNVTASTGLNVSEKLAILLPKLTLDADLTGKGLPKAKNHLALAADIEFDSPANQLNLTNLNATFNELKVTGNSKVTLAQIPVVRFVLKSPEINIDTLLASEAQVQAAQQASSAPASHHNSTASAQNIPSNDTPAHSKARSEAKTFSTQEPDLSALKELDIAGNIDIDKFVASNVKVSEVKTAFAIKQGVVNLTQFDANLYQGSIAATATLDATKTPATYKISNKIKDISVQPLLKDAAQIDLLAGKGSITLELAGQGLSEQRLRAGMTGTVGVHFIDGELYGVNVPEMIREAKAMLKGQQAEYVKEARKTDFSSLHAVFGLGNGIAKTQDLRLEAPALRVKGSGETSLIAETLNFNLAVAVVGSSKGQGGKNIDQLKDLTIPVAIGGSWYQPSYKIDLKALLSSNKVLEQKVQSEAEKGLKKLLGDKADDPNIKQLTDSLLNGLFK